MFPLDDEVPDHRAVDDPVLRSFWRDADLDPVTLVRLDSRIRLAGSWHEDRIPRLVDWRTDHWRDAVHDDSHSITNQVVRWDRASHSAEVVLTLNTSPVDWPWIEVAQVGVSWGGYLPGRPIREMEHEARISTRSPSRSDDVVDAILRLRARRRSRYFTCSRCGARRPFEDRCGDGAGHCCCSSMGIIH